MQLGLIKILTSKWTYIIVATILILVLLGVTVFCVVDLVKKFGIESEVNGKPDDTSIVYEEPVILKTKTEGVKTTLLNEKNIYFVENKIYLNTYTCEIYPYEVAYQKCKELNGEGFSQKDYNTLVNQIKTNKWNNWDKYVEYFGKPEISTNDYYSISPKIWQHRIMHYYDAWLSCLMRYVQDFKIENYVAKYDLNALTYDKDKIYFMSFNGSAVRCDVAENNYLTCEFPFEFVIPHSDNVTFNLTCDFSFFKQKATLTLSYKDSTNVEYFNQMLVNDGVKLDLIAYKIDDLILNEDITKSVDGNYSEVPDDEPTPTIDYSDLLPINSYNDSDIAGQSHTFVFELEDNYSYRLYCIQGDFVLGKLTNNIDDSVLWDDYYNTDNPDVWVYYDGAIGMKEDGDENTMTYGYYEFDNSKFHKSYCKVEIILDVGPNFRINATLAEMFAKNYIRFERVAK